MAEAGIASKADLVKLLQHAREQILKEWDISFAINGEVLSNIMNFISDINTDVPMKFYKDRIIIALKSPDNIQYAEIEINQSDVLDYKPNVDGDPGRKDAKSVMNGPEGEFKGILVDAKGTMEEIESFAQKDDIITIRIDTCYYKRIEFHCPGNVVIWAQLMDPTTAMKAIEKLPGVMKAVRSNPNIKKASAIIEPATFQRICSIGGKGGGKKRDVDERIFIELDKKDGLYITSGDKLKGRIFELKPMEVGMGAMAGISGVPEGVTGDTYGGDDGGGMVDDMMDEMGGVEEFAPGHNDKKKEDKKKPEKAPVDQLLGMDVDSTQYIYLSKEYMIPFTRLKGLAPIIVEVRTDKPIFLEQKPFGGIKAVLTIAPRIENEDDK